MDSCSAGAEREGAYAKHYVDYRYYRERRLNSLLKKALLRFRTQEKAFAAAQNRHRTLCAQNARLSQFYVSRAGELVYKAELQVAVLAQARRDVQLEIDAMQAAIGGRKLVDVAALEGENLELNATLQRLKAVALTSKVDYSNTKKRFSLYNQHVTLAPKYAGYTAQQISDFMQESETRFPGMPEWMKLALSLTLNNAQFLSHFGVGEYSDCGPAVGFHFLNRWTQALSGRLRCYLDDIYCSLEDAPAFKLKTFSALCWGWRALDRADGPAIAAPAEPLKRPGAPPG